MQLPLDNYYAIEDIGNTGGEKTTLTVVAEYDNEAEARQARSGFKVRGCEVYAEVGGKIYRVICPHQSKESDYRK